MIAHVHGVPLEELVVALASGGGALLWASVRALIRR